MRFLNTRTFRFEQVPDSELHLEDNQYAILSHRWGADEDEVSFEDIRLSKDFSNKKGSKKVEGFCKEASAASCRYGWIDTCCINKGNSTELSEAINSMYQWYQGSKVCIAYLEDVPQKQLIDSIWFNRGWTLQELISPKAITFFDNSWKTIGTKIKLIADLSRKTRIPESILSHATKLSTCSIAQRISWAANRVTTREEDGAYSLMGLFDINIPMIYEEREKAFLRLQQYIIQKSKDESIFAWTTEFPGNTKTYSGLFAPSSLAYASCSEIVQTQGSHGFSESNGELSIRLRLFPYSSETYCAVLNCTDRGYLDSKVFILIGRTSTEDEYVRVAGTKHASRGLIEYKRWTPLQERQIRAPEDPIEPSVNIFYGFWLVPPSDYGEYQTTILSNSQTPETNQICQHEYRQGIAGVVKIEPRKNPRFFERSKVRWLSFSFDSEFNPTVWLTRWNDKGIQNLFGEAVTSRPQSSAAHQQVMKTFDPRNNCNSVNTLVETIDRRKPDGRIINALDLNISVQLKSIIDCDGPSPSPPMKVWMVEISTIREDRLRKYLNFGLADLNRRVFAVFTVMFLVCAFLLGVEALLTISSH